MLPSFCNQVITRVRALTKDQRGSAVPDWNQSWSEEIIPCSVQPSLLISETSVSTDGRINAITDTLIVYCNPEVDIKVGDRIIYDNKIYTVKEEPRKWQSPTGRISNQQFKIVEYKG